MLEQDIMNEIRIFLSENGFLTFRFNPGKGKTVDGRYFDSGVPVGFPDIFALKNGQAYFFEVKRKGGVVSQKQKKMRLLLQKFNALCEVVYSVEDVKKCIIQ